MVLAMRGANGGEIEQQDVGSRLYLRWCSRRVKGGGV